MRRFVAFILSAAAVSLYSLPASAGIITQWNFNTIGTQSAPFNSPTPSTGTGTATTLGMTNTFNGGNTAGDDVLATAGTANAAFSENSWRIRGTGHNGWATNAAGAAQYTQGIELDTSTAGFSNIHFSFDWYSTTQGIRDLQFQYNTNINNAAGWTNFGGTSPTGTYVAVANDWYNAPGTNTPMIDVDLSSIASVNNDPNLGVRLVAAFDSTGNVPNDYAGAGLTGGLTTIYNNNSGNWRFDNLAFSSVPEPASLTLLGFAALALVERRRHRH